MFTGIIETTGRVVSVSPARLAVRHSTIAKRVKIGSSVSVSGMCLTVRKKKNGVLWFDVMPVTIRKTTLGKMQPDDVVNLESSLRIGDEVGGHFVFGHVDGVGTVAVVRRERHALLVTIRPPKALMRFIVPQGSVAIDGVSLTVARRAAGMFTVSLIPETLERTTLGNMQHGDRVNIECDMLAKYVGRMIRDKR